MSIETERKLIHGAAMKGYARFSWAVLLGATVASSACGPGSGVKPGSGDDFGMGGVPCSAVRPPTEPDLMGWDPGSRAKLFSLRSQGVVAVRYEHRGCDVVLQVLDRCIGTGDPYTYAAYSATERKVMRNAKELYASLPLGAASLGGKLSEGKALRTDYMLAGMYRLSAGIAAYPSGKLKGDCEGATHVVSTVYVGGFALAAGSRSDIEGGASVFGVGAGVGSSSSQEKITSEGNSAACGRAQEEGKESSQCSVPLRVALMPIDRPSAPIAATAPSTAPSTPATAATAAKTAVSSAVDRSSPQAVVDAYIAAAKASEKRAMLDLFAPEARAEEGKSSKAFTYAIADKGYKVVRVDLREALKIEGDQASTSYKVMFRKAEGDDSTDTMHFKLTNRNGGWWILSIE